MLSSDKNVESIIELIESLKDYIVLKKDYLKYDVVEKMVKLSTALVVGIIMVILISGMLLYLSFSAVYLLTPYLGEAGGFAVIAAVYLLFIILVLVNRKAWIERPLVKLLASILLSGHYPYNHHQ